MTEMPTAEKMQPSFVHRVDVVALERELAVALAHAVCKLPLVDAAVGAGDVIDEPVLGDEAWDGGELGSELVAHLLLLTAKEAIELEVDDEHVHGTELDGESDSRQARARGNGGWGPTGTTFLPRT